MEKSTLIALLIAFATLAPAASAEFGADVLRLDAAPAAPVLFRNWVTGTEELQRLAAEHPEMARLHSVGKSVRGLDLWVIEITDFTSNDPPIAARPVLWFDGNTHGNEQLGGEIAFEIANFLLTEQDTNETAAWIVKNRHVYILPIVNPDGNLQDSRYNGRGVNINRNWPAGWGGVGIGGLGNNPGAYAASEPETSSIIRYIESMPRAPDYFQSFHTGTVLWLYPWGFEEGLPPDNKMFARVCDEVFPGDDRCGPTYTTIYPASGIAVDWAYDALGASSWTYEVSYTQTDPGSLVPLREQLSEAWNGAMHALVNVEKYGAHLIIDALEILPLENGAYEVRAVITNDGYGDLAWADVGLAVAGSRVPGSVRVAELSAGESVTVSTVVQRLTPIKAGSLDIELEYPMRAWRTPMAHDVISLALKPGAGLELADDIATSLEVSYGAIEDKLLPSLGPLVVAFAAFAVALARRRRE